MEERQTLVSTSSPSSSCSTTWSPSVSWLRWRLSNSSKHFSSTGWVGVSSLSGLHSIFVSIYYHDICNSKEENDLNMLLYFTFTLFLLYSKISVKKMVNSQHGFELHFSWMFSHLFFQAFVLLTSFPNASQPFQPSAPNSFRYSRWS